MHQFTHSVGSRTYGFRDLKDLMAKATPACSGDHLAGVAAQMTLSALPRATFLNDVLVPYEIDEVTRLIIDSHDALSFAGLRHLTAGGFRNWLLSDEVLFTLEKVCLSMHPTRCWPR
jgi:ethanolamine ammonia-lyase large subunit